MTKGVKTLAAAACGLLAFAAAAAGETFDFVIETTQTNETFTFYLHDLKGITIDWGDGQAVSNLTAGQMRPTHTYADPGFYTNKLSGGATWVAFGVVQTTPRLLRDVLTPLSPAVTGIRKAESMFAGATGVAQFACAEWFDAASSNVTSMEKMFNGASAYNGSVAGWSVAQVQTMRSMFNGARQFNQNLDHWDVGNVTTMADMFRSATAFNGAVGSWNVGKVVNMSNMFVDAVSFNQDIGIWDVGKVTTMQGMLARAYAFKGDISRWRVVAVEDCRLMLSDSTLPTEHYNLLLLRWSRLPLQAGVVFDGGRSKYDLGRPAEARQRLISDFGWVITDGGATGNLYKDQGTAVIVR